MVPIYFQITYKPGHMHENLTKNGSQSNTNVTRKKGPIKNKHVEPQYNEDIFIGPFI